jgi:hypothetical protein
VSGLAARRPPPIGDDRPAFPAPAAEALAAAHREELPFERERGLNLATGLDPERRPAPGQRTSGREYNRPGPSRWCGDAIHLRGDDQDVQAHRPKDHEEQALCFGR